MDKRPTMEICAELTYFQIKEINRLLKQHKLGNLKIHHYHDLANIIDFTFGENLKKVI